MPAIRRLNHEGREFVASLGSITRPCSDHTTSHKNLKTEKYLLHNAQEIIFFPFQDKMNVLASKFQAMGGQPSLGMLVWGICILGTRPKINFLFYF